jgi:hypothetical protein
MEVVMFFPRGGSAALAVRLEALNANNQHEGEFACQEKGGVVATGQSQLPSSGMPVGF